MRNDYYIAIVVVAVLAYFPFTHEEFGSADEALSYLSEAEMKPYALYFPREGNLKTCFDGDERIFEFKGDSFEKMKEQLACDGWKCEKLFTTKHWGSVWILYWKNYPPFTVKKYQRNADTLGPVMNWQVWKCNLKRMGWFYLYAFFVFGFAFLVHSANYQYQTKRQRRRLLRFMRRMEMESFRLQECQ